MSALWNIERDLLTRDVWEGMRFLFVAALMISVNPGNIDCFNKPFKQFIKVQMVVFWNVTPFSLVGRCQNFGGPLSSLDQKKQDRWQKELHTAMSYAKQFS
jgi:hypothetical protein